MTVAALASLLVLALLSPGCGPQTNPFYLAFSQRPTVVLTAAPIGVADTAWYAYEIQWSGNDPDGSVERFEYVIDPPTALDADTVWIPTTRTGELFHFRSTDAYWDPAHGWRSKGFHTFAIRAIDNAGLVSAVISRAFYSYTIAPTVRIVNPVPNAFISRTLPSVARIEWEGADDDGTGSRLPVKYKYRVIAASGSRDEYVLARTDPDSLRRFHAARNFAEWDSVGGDTTWATPLTHQLGDCVFVVIAIDEAGAYSPAFSFEGNMLSATISNSPTLGPVFTVWNEFFNFTYMSGGYDPDPLNWINLEVPSARPVTFHWLARPPEGTTIAGYRWRLDGDIGDETPRSNEQTDWWHWSHSDPATTSCTIGPFPGGEEHFLYIEAVDAWGQRSIVIVHFQSVAATGERELLVVDDTRMPPDRFNPPNPVPATYGNTVWPSAAELDTFLFARGGFPWRGPQGVFGDLPLSKPGLFAGYSFDTLGTRQGFELASAGVPLGLLGRYRHLLWLTDYIGVTTTSGPAGLIDPISTLRWMSAPGRMNTLAAYIAAGGQVWLAGGTAASCTLLPVNATGSHNNDHIYGPGHTVFSYTDGELAPGRLMWDAAHWRSEMVASLPATLPKRSNAALGGWSHPSWNHGGMVTAPDYSRLPAQLRRRSLALGDSLPPTRTNAASFYTTAVNPAVEYLTQPNIILEDVDPDPAVVDTRSVLDTLMELQGGALATNYTGQRPVAMTYYHGFENPPFVFSGFDLWTWSRQDAAGLVDFVLHEIWGMNRTMARPLSPRTAQSRPAPAALPMAPPGRPVATPHAAPARVPGAGGRGSQR
jgi:hypothetical protein